MLHRVYEDTPFGPALEAAVEALRNDGVIIYPTDTLYAIGCSIESRKGIERIVAIKGLRAKEALFSFICSSISQIADYARISKDQYTLLRKNLPGPFTFILPGLNRVPGHFLSRRKTVGVRVPGSAIARSLVEALGEPIVTSSLPFSDESEYGMYPELMEERWGKRVDMVLDGGMGGLEPSTVVDCSDGQIEILREGKGKLEE